MRRLDLFGILLSGAFCLLACAEEKNTTSQGARRVNQGGSSPYQNIKKLESKVEHPQPPALAQANYFITKMNYPTADRLLLNEVGADAAMARARLAIYRGDCEGALDHLVSKTVRGRKGAEGLYHFSVRCARATAGSIIFEDKKRGVWIRLQDEADKVLAPYLVEVGVRARAALEQDLGVQLPRPLRIDLVRDLFSLSSVSGLPLESAETTGTVAVARWGRITMVSPRAMHHGFPWADTLAHEITHLLLSLATADRAPLWLQEGIAKREEQRWRHVRPFDGKVNAEERAYKAQVEGKSVGVDAIGPSIAMLPSAEAASISYAEVAAFVEYWIASNGVHSLALLLGDVETAPNADSAMRSVSGYGVSEWQILWRAHMEKKFQQAPESVDWEEEEQMGPRALSRVLRLTTLLTIAGYPDAAASQAAPALERAPHSAALRFLAARAGQLAERDDVPYLLGTFGDVDSAHGGWLALSARELGQDSSLPKVRAWQAEALDLDPLLPEVACAGVPWAGPTEKDTGSDEPTALCLHARSLTLRGSR